jgi:hypothetical protein
MLAATQTFADLSLTSRAAAAVNAIDTYALTIEQRCELVALAVWPTDISLPGSVSRAARVPDVDLRPARPTVRAPAAAMVVERPSTPEQRAEARAAFRAGASIAALGALRAALAGRSEVGQRAQLADTSA